MTMMTAPEFMTASETREATGKARARDQSEWLKERGIPHRLDGRRVILSRAHFRAWLEGAHVPVSGGINWAAVV